MEDPKHCPDHIEHTVCLRGLKQQFEMVRKDGHAKLGGVGKEVHAMWETLNKKLDATTFKWFNGLLVIVLLTILAAGWAKLDRIDNKMQIIEISNAVIAERLNVEEVVESRLKSHR